MFLTVSWSVFVHFVQLYTKRVSCAVPLRIVTMKAAGELTPSHPAVIDIIPDQVPLIQGRRQQTTHPLPKLKKSYTRKQTPHPKPMRRHYQSYESSDSSSEEFPNANDYSGYYYDKDYYRYYKSYYVDDGDVNFQFKHPRYPYGHTMFAEALVMKQVPHVFKEVFFPTKMQVRVCSIFVDEFKTVSIPFEVFPRRRMQHRRAKTNKITKKTTILLPQTQHPYRSRNLKENPNSKLSYNEERKDGSKYSSTKTNKYNADKSANNKDFQSVLSYNAYNEDGNVEAKSSLYKKKRPNPKKRTKPSKFRRLLEMLKTSTPAQVPDVPDYAISVPGDAQDGPPIFLHADVNHDYILENTASTVPDTNARRQGEFIDSHERSFPERNLPIELSVPDVAGMAIAPAVSFFKNLLSG